MDPISVIVAALAEGAADRGEGGHSAQTDAATDRALLALADTLLEAVSRHAPDAAKDDIEISGHPGRAHG